MNFIFRATKAKVMFLEAKVASQNMYMIFGSEKRLSCRKVLISTDMTEKYIFVIYHHSIGMSDVFERAAAHVVHDNRFS